MSNRLDIELTSIRSDGSFTWRAAGARQPKGVIDAKVLADSAKVGDILRVEAEVEIDGITILGVLPPKEKVTPAGRIELLGSSKPIPAVTTVLLSEGGHGDRRDLLDSPRRSDRSGSRDRRPGRGAERPDGRRPQPAAGGPEAAGERRPERRPRADGAPLGRPPRGGDGRPAPSVADRRPERRPRPEGPPAGGSPRNEEGRPATSGADRRPERRPRPEGVAAGASAPTAQGRPATSGAERRPRPPSTSRRPAPPAGERGPADGQQPGSLRGAQPQATPRRTVPRFEPGTAHRDLLFAGLASEQRPIAERLAAGGIPAVRRAIAAERERARSEGRPEVTGEAILALAEQLAPSVKQAIWLDRAEAVVAQLDQISLRDLRTTVVAAAPRDEASRDLDRKLREELDRRVKKLRSNWEDQITRALEEGRVLQALRFSSQPPEPTARFPAALVGRLATSAGAAMTSSTPVERWLAILEAAVSSPIRRQIHPDGLPEDPSGEVVRKARLAAGGIPALAPMLGLPMPPPPKPLRSARPLRPTRPPRPVARTARQAVRTAATANAETRADAAGTETAQDDALPELAEPAEPSSQEATVDAAPPEAPEAAEAALSDAPEGDVPSVAPERAEVIVELAPEPEISGDMAQASDNAQAEAGPEQPSPVSADSAG